MSDPRLLGESIDRVDHCLTEAARAYRAGEWERCAINLRAVMLFADDAQAVADSVCAALDRGPAIEAARRRRQLKRG